jgi:hypothetical protein|tara:strand:+ start:478 stop:738 length:261 start_codon:yes stop_codon:yes gene_type:complete
MGESSPFALDIVFALGVTLLFFCSSWFDQDRWRALASGALFVVVYFTSWYTLLSKLLDDDPQQRAGDSAVLALEGGRLEGLRLFRA